ncbi:MAG: hypothetical protein ACKPBU_10645 [Alphaproteobacteria bacterium]
MARLRLAIVGTTVSVALLAGAAGAVPSRRAAPRAVRPRAADSAAVGTIVPGSHPEETGGTLLDPAQGGLRQTVDRLAWRVDELTRGEAAPPWAAGIGSNLDQRMERLLEMQERMAARIETPVPRLDEPIVLFTVGAATGLLGFFLGRSVQRRRDRREGSFRL